MSTNSKRQGSFFKVVSEVQQGQKSLGSVPRDVRKVAKRLNPKMIQEFVSSNGKKLPLKLKMEMLGILKEFQEPMMLQEGQTNPIAKEFTAKGDYKQYVDRFVGQPLSTKELESVNNYSEVKPKPLQKTKPPGSGDKEEEAVREIQYESSDQFNNNTTTIIKKLREGSQFSYTAFTKYTQTKPKEEPAPEAPPGGEPPPGGAPEPGGAPPPMQEQDSSPSDGAPPGADPTADGQPEKQPEDIIVAKSTAFADDISGAKTLSDFLRKLDL